MSNGEIMIHHLIVGLINMTLKNIYEKKSCHLNKLIT